MQSMDSIYVQNNNFGVGLGTAVYRALPLLKAIMLVTVEDVHAQMEGLVERLLCERLATKSSAHLNSVPATLLRGLNRISPALYLMQPKAI